MKNYDENASKLDEKGQDNYRQRLDDLNARLEKIHKKVKRSQALIERLHRDH